jgi:valyl-tRNA synthetase
MEAASAAAARATLGYTLSTLLKLLHPFTPFLTEALWAEVPASLRGGAEMLMVADWPQADGQRNVIAEDRFAQLQDAVRAIRNVRALLETPSSEKPSAVLLCDEAKTAQDFAAQRPLIEFMARLDGAEIRCGGTKPAAHGTDVFRGGSVFVPFDADTDPAKLRGSLEKKLKKVEGGIRAIDGKLGNDKFLAKADPEVVASERERRVQLETELATLQANLEGIPT